MRAFGRDLIRGAQQLMGTAIRPQHPNGSIIDHDTGEVVTAPVELRNVTVTIPVTTNDERDEEGGTPS